MATESALMPSPVVQASDWSIRAPLFLTPVELEELTGYKINSKQVQWLAARGWRYEVSAIGRAKVSRSYCEARMGVSGENSSS